MTGGTGHVGTIIIDQLLKEGHGIRATARHAKLSTLKKTYDYPDATSGRIYQDPFMLVALYSTREKPLTSSVCDMVEELSVQSANEGTQYLLNALTGSSIKRFVLTASIGVFFDLRVVKSTAWRSTNPFFLKLGTQLRVSTPGNISHLVPCSVYSWYPKDYPIPQKTDELNVNQFLYQLIRPNDASFPNYPLPDLVHNRDVANAHIRALTAPALPQGQKKRLIVSGGYMTRANMITFLKAPETVAKLSARGHDIIGRSPPVSTAPRQSLFRLDASLTESVLGMKKENYISWQEILWSCSPP
ncbi:hypothetical protein B0H14DRAFT_3166185 [Mycena olivaceomarginata]|nr:hypothetical protein B0H14DRAFT_3166185 [Mycena olivaceomarginata]